MQTSIEQIITSFAPETRFNVQTKGGPRRRGMMRRHNEPGAGQLPPLVVKPFEQRGVPFSALND